MGVDLLLSIMLMNTVHHAWCGEKRLELPSVISSKVPFGAEILSLDDSFIESFHSSKTVYRGLMNFSIIGEIHSKCIKASIKKMCRMNLIFGLGGGPELLGFRNLAFHLYGLENIACFHHLELLYSQFFLQFTIFFSCDYQYFSFYRFLESTVLLR